MIEDAGGAIESDDDRENSETDGDDGQSGAVGNPDGYDGGG